MKRFFGITITLILLCCALPLSAQSYKFLPKKTHRMTQKEMRGIRLSPTLPSYTQEGVKLDQMETMKRMSSPKFMMELFGNENGEPSAIVLRESTPEEAEAKLSMFMKMDNTGDWKNKEAPVFAKLNMDSEGFNLKEKKGSVVALNFWYIGCKPCIMEMPELNEMVEKYHDQDVEFIAVALDSKERLVPFLQRMAFDYDVIPDARDIAKLYDITGYPSHLLIDQEGKVQFFSRGYNGALVSILDKRIENLLKADN